MVYRETLKAKYKNIFCVPLKCDNLRPNLASNKVVNKSVDKKKLVRWKRNVSVTLL